MRTNRISASWPRAASTIASRNGVPRSAAPRFGAVGLDAKRHQPAALGARAARQREVWRQQERLHATVVQRLERRLGSAGGPASRAQPGRETVQSGALDALLVVLDQRRHRGADLSVGDAGKVGVHAFGDQQGPQLPAQQLLEPRHDLGDPAQREPLERLAAPILLEHPGHATEMLIDLFLDAALVVGLRQAAAFALAADVVRDALGGR